MPKILTSAGSDLDFLIPSDGRNSHALTELIAALAGPPDLQGIGAVVLNAGSCVHSFLGVTGIDKPSTWDYARSLHAIGKALLQDGSSQQPFATAGRATRYAPWTLLHTVSDKWRPNVLAGIGAELVRSKLMQQVFLPTTARHLLRVCNTPASDLVDDKFALKLIQSTVALVDAASSTSSRELKTNCLIQASISSQLNPMKIEQRQAAGSTLELTEAEMVYAARQLKESALSGCLLSLQIIICFSLGLPWDVALEVPFSTYVDGEWVAQIDVRSGISKVDLESCLPGMATGTKGHLESSPVLVRPLPEFAAKLLHRVVSMNPSAWCLRKLNDTDVHSTSLIPGSAALSKRISIAKVIASRGGNAMRAGLNRATAAYVTADLSKIGKSKNYYTTFSPTEIWNGSALVYKYLGWGSPVLMESDHMLYMGSRATPTEETVTTIDLALRTHHSSSKAGKKYTRKSLEAHTNAFSLLCAHRTAFFSLGRAAETYAFFANDFVSGRPFGVLGDKVVGPHGGKTPLPVPICTWEQIRLWLAHLKIHDARLLTLGVLDGDPVRMRIRQILAGEKVRLFFQVNSAGEIRDVGSSNISLMLPKELRIKPDFARHYLQNKLRHLNVPQAWIDAAARHHVDGVSVTYATANLSQVQWLSEVANQMDQVAVSLRFLPIVGLGRGNSK